MNAPPPIITKDEEIAALKQALERTRGQLSNALQEIITLSIRNLELIKESKSGRVG